MPRFLVAARLQNLCGKPHQLAEILRGEVNEVQILGTKIDLWRPLLDTLAQGFALALLDKPFFPQCIELG
jgi:hypothetical protein